MSVPATFKAAITDRAADIRFWMEIEGLPHAYGDVARGAGWFAARAAADQFLSVLPYFSDEVPPLNFESELDPLEGLAKTMGQVSVTISDIDGFLTTITGNAKKDDWCYLSADITKVTATLGYTGVAPLASFPAGGGTLYIGAETITYTAHDNALKQFTGCNRGRYRSRAKAFGKGFPISPRPYVLKGRRAWYYQTAEQPGVAVTDADKALRFAGTFESYRVSDKDPLAYVAVFQSLEKALNKKVFRELRSFHDDVSAGMAAAGATNGLHLPIGAAVNNKWRPTDQKQVLANGDRVICRIDDELVLFERASSGSDTYLQLLERGVFGTVLAEHKPGFTAKEIAWVNGSNPSVRHNKFSSIPSTASPLPRNHPLIVLLQLLLSTGNGTNTAGGRNYDVLPESWGLGIDVSRIDVTGIEAVAGEHPDLRVSGVIEEPTNFIDLARMLLRPYGFFAATTIGDLWTVRYLRPPLPDEAIRTLGESTRINGSKSGWDANLGGMVQEVVFRYARDLRTGKYTQIAVGKLLDVNVQANGEGQRKEYEMFLSYSVAGVTGKPSTGEHPNIESYLQTRADAIRQRYKSPPPVITERVDYSWLDCEAGDLVAVDHTQLPDAVKAARGLTQALGQIRAKRVDEKSRTIGLTIELTGYNLGGYKFVAPCLEVETNVSTTKCIVRANYFTEPTKNGLAQTDLKPRDSNGAEVDCFEPFIGVKLYDANWVLIGTTAVTAINHATREVTLGAALNPQPGQRIVYTDHFDTIESATTPAIPARFAFLADSALIVNTDGAPGHKYFP